MPLFAPEGPGRTKAGVPATVHDSSPYPRGSRVPAPRAYQVAAVLLTNATAQGRTRRMARSNGAR